MKIPNLPENGKLGRAHFDWNQIRQLNFNAISSSSSTLFEFHLHDNKISILPPELAFFSSLKVLDVSNNNINDIPATIGYMESLQRFDFMINIMNISILFFVIIIKLNILILIKIDLFLMEIQFVQFEDH